MRTVVVLNPDPKRHGDRELGREILGTFLRQAIARGGLDAIAGFPAGVQLAAAGKVITP